MPSLPPIISNQDLPDHNFSTRDAVFFTDAAQVEYLTSHANPSFRGCWACPLSLQAYGALLRRGHSKIISYFRFIDFADCKDWYHRRALHYAENWLHELGLSFMVGKLDVARLDSACQFLFFLRAAYLGPTAERLIRANLEIETFHVFTAADRLPQEFYFDSDVPAAILQGICEKLGRPARAIATDPKSRYIFPDMRNRPLVDTGAQSLDLAPRMRKTFRASRHRVGFVPATVLNTQRILDATRRLGCATVLFPSSWGAPPVSAGDDGQDSDFIFRLTAADGDWSSEISAKLDQLASSFFESRSCSTLPDFVIHNPHLDFQFEYIIRRRWLAYANMIYRAARFVAETPLDLFICSDHFTAEGAILAGLYRQRRTRVLVSLHSGWPCDRNWIFYRRPDAAMVPTKSCAKRVADLSGVYETYVTGSNSSRAFRSLVRSAALQALRLEKRRAAGGRKTVLLLTNALELDSVPFTDLKSHFETFATLAHIPKSLQDRILVLLRTKPGVFGEDSMLYHNLNALPVADGSLFDGLTFSESIQLADCVVGVNVATTGYFEVMEAGIPLLHIQTADVISLQPDIPETVIERISNHQKIWPAIEAILFDDQHREQVVRAQRQFISLDTPSDPAAEEDPVQALIQKLVHRRGLAGLSSLWRRFANFNSGATERQPLSVRHPDLRSMCIVQQGGAGFVDDILLGPSSKLVIEGWAADLASHCPAKSIHLFHNARWVAATIPHKFRPDVAKAHGDSRLELSGFTLRAQVEGEAQPKSLVVFAELHDGSFHQLESSSPQAFTFGSESRGAY